MSAVSSFCDGDTSTVRGDVVYRYDDAAGAVIGKGGVSRYYTRAGDSVHYRYCLKIPDNNTITTTIVDTAVSRPITITQPLRIKLLFYLIMSVWNIRKSGL